MTTRRVFMAGMSAGGALVLRHGRAAAQARAEYPDRPVRIVVPYAAGGGNDLLARIYGGKLAEAFNQPFVVDNRPGASAVIGTEAVIRARPDGTTLLVHASGPVLAEKGAGKPAYDRQSDLTPVAVLGAFAGMVLVRADHPARSVAELVEWLRANPAKGNYGTGGTGFQLLGAFFAQRAGLSLEGVIYRSSTDAMTALAAGDVMLAFSDPGPARAAIEAGRARVLAVSSTHRLSTYPEVPTTVEAGFPGFVVDYWIGLFGPAGLPPEVVRRLSSEVRRIAAMPDVREKLALNSVEPGELDPEGFRRAIIANDALWVAVAQRAGISLER